MKWKQDRMRLTSSGNQNTVSRSAFTLHVKLQPYMYHAAVLCIIPKCNCSWAKVNSKTCFQKSKSSYISCSAQSTEVLTMTDHHKVLLPLDNPKSTTFLHAQLGSWVMTLLCRHLALRAIHKRLPSSPCPLPMLTATTLSNASQQQNLHRFIIS